MKKYILAIAAAAMTMTACNDWLDVEPSTQMDQTDLFASEAGFADAITGVYASMTSDTLYGKNLTWYGVELMGGGASYTYGDPGNYASFYFYPKAEYYYESIRRGFVDQIWGQMYNAIANCNAILSKIDEYQGSFEGDDYSVMKGEVLGLRAFLHFDLLRLFGGSVAAGQGNEALVPYVSALSSNVYPLLNTQDFAKFLIADLEQAVTLLEKDPIHLGTAPSTYLASAVSGGVSYRNKYGIADYHNRRLHFNYYAALATLARVYLWVGDTTNALAYAQKVIEAQEERFPWTSSDLIANIQASYETCKDHCFSTEQIFALNIKNLNDKTDGKLWEGKVSFNSIDGSVVCINDECFDAVGKSYDPRFVYLTNAGSMYGTPYYCSNKLWDEEQSSYYSPWAEDRLPLIRVSEMYYIAAECEPNVEKANEYLDAVRAHRGLSAYPLTCTSKAELQEQIATEYAREFISEGQLFYYRKRMGQPFSWYNLYYTGHDITPEMMVLPRPDDEDTYGGRNN